MKIPWVLIGIVVLACTTVEAQTAYFECPDVATSLPEAGEMSFDPWDIVENDLGAYSVAKSLPENTPLDAVHRLGSGDTWLLSVEYATRLGPPPPGSTFPPDWDRRDVILWDGANDYSSFEPYEGAVALIPAGSNIDALFVDPTGAVVVSFDVNTNIASVEYDPADLVRYDQATASFEAAPYFDASSVGIPNTSNLISADRRGLLTVFSLDVETIAGRSSFLPGELISWDGQALAVFDPQPGWPANLSSQVNALTFAGVPASTDPGSIGPSLRVGRQDGGSLRLGWTASDCAGGGTAAVYQGNLGSLHTGYDHTPVVCADVFPFLQEVVPLPQGDAYFLVAARSAVPTGQGEEGSYGQGQAGGVMAQRPVGQGSCAPVQMLGCQ